MRLRTNLFTRSTASLADYSCWLAFHDYISSLCLKSLVSFDRRSAFDKKELGDPCTARVDAAPLLFVGSFPVVLSIFIESLSRALIFPSVIVDYSSRSSSIATDESGGTSGEHELGLNTSRLTILFALK